VDSLLVRVLRLGVGRLHAAPLDHKDALGGGILCEQLGKASLGLFAGVEVTDESSVLSVRDVKHDPDYRVPRGRVGRRAERQAPAAPT
jgi:hypothetical protein